MEHYGRVGCVCMCVTRDTTVFIACLMQGALSEVGKCCLIYDWCCQVFICKFKNAIYFKIIFNVECNINVIQALSLYSKLLSIG